MLALRSPQQIALPQTTQTKLTITRFSAMAWPSWARLSEGGCVMWLSGRRMEEWPLDDAALADRIAKRTAP